MRCWLLASALVLVAIAAAWAWPFVGAAELAAAARRNDAAAVMERVDLPALRRSLSRQIADAYLDVTGKARKLNGLGRSLAGAAATTVADPYVEQFLTPENILNLLANGKVGAVTLSGKPVAVSSAIPQVPSLLTSDLIARLTGSYFDGIASFVIPVSGGQAAGDEFRIHLRLSGATWRLAGLDLPPNLVQEMARGVMATGAVSPPP